MASADESSPAQLRRRFHANDLTLPPGLLDLLREAIDGSEQIIGDDALPDPYFGPDWRVTVATRRTRKGQDKLYLLHIPATILRHANQRRRESISYLEGILKEQPRRFRVLIFSMGLDRIDEAFKAMFDDWSGPDFIVEFVPWGYIRNLEEEKGRERQVQFILGHFAQ
jgi:hypothetical protein